MRQGSQYPARIRSLRHAGLVRLWKQIRENKTPGWDPGRAFEHAVVRAFELEGAIVQYPYSVSLHEVVVEEIDGIVYTNGIAAMIESKDHGREVNIAPIAKLRNQLLRRPAPTIGLVFSRRGFTAPAKMLAGYLAPQAILLWDGAEFEYALKRKAMIRGLVKKYFHAVASGIPDYNLLSEGAL